MSHPFRLFLIFGLIFTIFVPNFSKGQDWKNHDFLVEEYNGQHETPLQLQYRKLAPMPVGCVYVQRPGDDEKEMRQQFRIMKDLGFTALKQIMPIPGWTIEQIQLIALEEGLIPWWYGQGGWAPITDELLSELNIPSELSIEKIRTHPRMRDYQEDVLRSRIETIMEYKRKHGDDDPALKGSSVAFDPQVGGRGIDLTDEGQRLFLDWVKKRYDSIADVNHQYNMMHAGLAPDGEPFESWEDFEQRWQEIGPKEYGHMIDIFRFKADNSLKNTTDRAEKYGEIAPDAPFRGGGELGLFLPFPWYNVDMEGIADLMQQYGTFYPSIHFSWHFNRVNHEVVRTTYMQASLAKDFFKGGWAASWEATGGPQHFSGGSGGKGFHVDGGVLTQFVLSHLAAGFRGFGLWTWSARTAGWEAGEYSLADRHNNPTPRARKVGEIGKAMQKYRDELWEARKEPLVGIYYDWNSDAHWTAISIQGRDAFRDYPMQARVGVARALINSNVPFEHVTASDIRNDLALRYPIIYLPGTISLSADIIEKLTQYVKQGGRLVMDLPGAWFNENAAMLYTEKGTLFEILFGITINDFQFSGVNVYHAIEELPLEGFTLRSSPTKAEVLYTYENGAPAVTENKFGSGEAVMLGYEASRMCFEPGNDLAEASLIKYTLGEWSSPYSCQGSLAYRLAGKKADHYFLINDGTETSAIIESDIFEYSIAEDAVTGESIDPDSPIVIQRNNGRWIRFEK